MPAGADFHPFVVQRPGAAGPAAFTWRPDVCDRTDLRPDYRQLDETNLVAFLRDNQLDVHVERQPVEANKPELVFVFVSAAGSAPVALRVAILKTPDEAGHDLYDALTQRGDGWWGVHRANLAVLGPPADPAKAISFAARTRLACWGTFTFAHSSDTFVVAGGYAEP
ncbi:MAG: hypothetical protein FWD17_11125 [Polyangiaceae bacterium]|nr:hypothetical protein [Polyangiaceae bacterium]